MDARLAAGHNVWPAAVAGTSANGRLAADQMLTIYAGFTAGEKAELRAFRDWTRPNIQM